MLSSSQKKYTIHDTGDYLILSLRNIFRQNTCFVGLFTMENSPAVGSNKCNYRKSRDEDEQKPDSWLPEILHYERGDTPGPRITTAEPFFLVRQLTSETT